MTTRRILTILLILAGPASGQETPPPSLLDGDPTAVVAPKSDSPKDFAPSIQVVLIMTALSVLPAALMTMTSFTRIIIVLGFVRRALAVQEMPPNQVLIGLSMFLTLVVMNPVISKIHTEAFGPYLDGKLPLAEASQKAGDHLGDFLLTQTREEDLLLLVDITGIEKPPTPDDVPLHILVPAFALSELRTAFQMGFLIYLPFLVVDLVVASILLSMGMFMLPPVIVSTPFKILLFVLVDGWDLVVRSLVRSFEPSL